MIRITISILLLLAFTTGNSYADDAFYKSVQTAEASGIGYNVAVSREIPTVKGSEDADITDIIAASLAEDLSSQEHVRIPCEKDVIPGGNDIDTRKDSGPFSSPKDKDTNPSDKNL
jgi:hypothetical protein